MGTLNLNGKLRKWGVFATAAVFVTILAVALFAQQGKGRPGGGGGGGGEVEEAGNNLSTPVIINDGNPIVLRGVFGQSMFMGEKFTDASSVDWYLQQDELNEWQAESLDISESASPFFVDWIDWGDNLEARPWSDKSIVRCEVVLWQDLTVPMLGYEMQHLWGDGQTEMWGTNTETYDSFAATVYSHKARFVIQKFADGVDPETALVTWDDFNHKWLDEDLISAPFFTGAVYEGDGEGHASGYSAEINVSGKVIYGYNWNVRTAGDGAGRYRLTFCLEFLPTSCTTFFNQDTQVKPFAEEESAVFSVQAEPVGGKTYIVPEHNLTYIDIEIVPATGKGGPGGKNRR